MGLYFAWRYGVWAGVLSGVFCGVLFGFLFPRILSRFVRRQRQLLERTDGIFEGQVILFQGGANHFLHLEGRGGLLTLTPARLAFRSHGKNFQNAPLDIPLSEMAAVDLSLTLGLVPNGLRITRTNGRKESFVVTARELWKARIEEARRNLEPGRGAGA